MAHFQTLLPSLMIIYNEIYFSKEADMFIWQMFLKPKYMFKLFFSTIHVYIPIQTALWSEKYTSKPPESTGIMLLNIRSIVEWWSVDASRDMAGYYTWPREYANKQCHKV